MRYELLKPKTPTFDPRAESYPTPQELYEDLESIGEVESQAQAADQVRRIYPDALAIPFHLKLGSSRVTVLGMIDDDMARQAINVDRAIPFVFFVRPVPQHDTDRALIKRGQVFDEFAWKLQPVVPDIYTSQVVELRSGELRVPVFVAAKVGTHKGRLAIFIDVGGSTMSIVFQDPGIKIGDVVTD